MHGFLGIDVGKTGAFGLLDGDGAYLDAFDMPYIKDDLDMAAIDAWCGRDHGVKVVAIALERQHAFPGQGVSSAFGLGVSYGMLLAWCYRAGVKLYVPLPTVWKRQAKLNADKEETRLRAVREFPTAPLSLKKHHGRAEALFLAEYARREYTSSH